MEKYNIVVIPLQEKIQAAPMASYGNGYCQPKSTLGLPLPAMVRNLCLSWTTVTSVFLGSPVPREKTC